MFTEIKKYDLVFIGLGASNSLIINTLYSAKILQRLNIAVFEPDPKDRNDKTYCFWATETEVSNLQLSNLIDRSWTKITCKPKEKFDISPLRYYHVSSINLYNQVKEILSNCNVDYYPEIVTDLINKSPDNSITINTITKSIETEKIFDSRPPQWLEGDDHQTFLWQSFLGWKIKTTKDVFDKNVFTMMDFEVDQSNATQFIYILPYGQNHALVELTRFGINPIDHTYARFELDKYCRKKNWEFTLIEEEKGMIPMSTMNLKDRSVNENHIQTGSAAGKIKPTTGYAFKEMALDAVNIATDFLSDNPTKKKLQPNSLSGKFGFYDRLLLKILEKNPEKGKLIFTELFSKVDIKLVLKFLDQKTFLWEDISVMMSLPKGIFIKQAILDCFYRLKPFLSFLLPLLITLLCIFLQIIRLETINLILLTIGMLLVGIPHGAMDHILEKKSTENLTVFIAKYIVKIVVMFFLWKISPITGLLFFLFYSAWHFGQADFIKWNLQPNLTSFFWGMGIVLFLLFSHPVETNNILNQIFNNNILNEIISNSFDIGSVLSFAFMLLSYIFNRNKWLAVSILTISLLYFVPLIQAFGIYFIFQHSLNGWLQIKNKLQKSNFELWRHSLPFTLGAVLLFITFFSTPNLNWQKQLGTFFIFLSCISFPHVIIMNQFYKNWKFIK